jgi:hypothetical protein
MYYFTTGQTDTSQPISDFCSCRTASGKYRSPIQQRSVALGSKSKKTEEKISRLASLQLRL